MALKLELMLSETLAIRDVWVGCINFIVAQLKTGIKNISQVVSSTQKFPKGKWTSNFKFIQVFAAIYFVLAFTPFVSYLTVSVVSEKEKKIKESLRMVGMRDSAYW